MHRILIVLALVAVACSRGGGGAGDDTPAPAPSADGTPSSDVPASAPAPRTGSVYEVQMLVTPDGQFVYQPDVLYVKQGDLVRWVNASGGPHNVAFYRNALPPGAADFLNATMTERMGDLTGKLLFEPDAVYEISFAGAPVGTYEYFCTPHEMLGMKAQLTVSR